MNLEVETKTFESLRKGMVQSHQGQYAIIRGEVLEAIKATCTEAMDFACEKFGTKGYLVKRIEPNDRVETIHCNF